MRLSLLGSFSPIYTDILIQSEFSPYRVSQKMDWLKSYHFLAHFLAFSIFWTPCMVKIHFISMYLGLQAPQRLIYEVKPLRSLLSIFWDTLYGENTLYIIISMYLGLKASQRLSLIKKFFFLRATVMLNVINLNFSPISWYFQFFRTPYIVKKDLE